MYTLVTVEGRMKFKIAVSDFQYAMRLVRDVVPASGPVAESVGVLVSAANNKAVFTAFNPEVVAKATVKIVSERDGEAVVDAAALNGAISRFQSRNDKNIGTSDITVTSAPRSKKLQISATTRYSFGNETPHKRVFPLHNHEFFPDTPSFNSTDTVFKIPAEILMEGIDSVFYAVSSDKSKIIFTGVYFKLSNNTLTLAATDGICLAEYEVGIDYEGAPVEVVLPGPFAAKISKSFFDHDELRIALTPSMMFVSTPNLILGGALIKDSYPDYKAILPNPPAYAVLNKHIFLDNLLNLSYEANTVDDSRVSVVFEGGKVSLVCGASNNEGLLTDFKDNFRFDCNLKLLALSIKNIVGDELLIGFSSPSEPLKLSSTTESHTGAKFNCILVPLSLR
jgi:DNA polymerase III sliding clamp (beta) subunit (PCNA family)